MIRLIAFLLFIFIGLQVARAGVENFIELIEPEAPVTFSRSSNNWSQ